jgi:5-carboxymethyl-2-hydroxymuconate isomerase
MQCRIIATHRCQRACKGRPPRRSGSGHFAPNVVRTFAREADFSCVADEVGGNCFVQIVMRMAPGRTREVRKEIAQLVFAAAAYAVAEELERGRLGLRVDISESDQELSASRNTLPL